VIAISPGAYIVIANSSWNGRQFLLAVVILLTCSLANAGVMEYGNENVLNTGTYPSDPKAGATLQGLAPGAVTFGTLITGHVFPFSPSAGDFAGTDQIYVGSVQTGAHDGYSVATNRINGPDVLTMDYSSLVTGGQQVATLTFGIAADDFQFPAFGQPFTAKVNGITNAALTSALESLNEGGPVVQFLTVGIDPAFLLPSNVLTVSIDEGGDGGDGYAVDFVTVGVTLRSVPEPASAALFGLGAVALLGYSRRRSGQVAKQ
jgi:hypothetical protein